MWTFHFALNATFSISFWNGLILHGVSYTRYISKYVWDVAQVVIFQVYTTNIQLLPIPDVCFSTRDPTNMDSITSLNPSNVPALPPMAWLVLSLRVLFTRYHSTTPVFFLVGVPNWQPECTKLLEKGTVVVKNIVTVTVNLPSVTVPLWLKIDAEPPLVVPLE